MAANLSRRSSPRRSRNPEPTPEGECPPGFYFRSGFTRTFLGEPLPIKATCAKLPTQNPWWDAVRAFTAQAGGNISAAEAASLLSPYWRANRATAVQDALGAQEVQNLLQGAAERRAASPRRRSPRRRQTRGGAQLGTQAGVDTGAGELSLGESVLGLGGGAGQGGYGRRYASYRGRSGSQGGYRSRSGSQGRNRNYQYGRNYQSGQGF